jgi:eukaryotic-like serine/threonine-protein kinase
VIWIPDAALDRLRDAADWPDLGDTKYVVRERIGHGGMGTVYRALDRELGREVAIKVLNAADAPSGLAKRMIREARTLARLEHPGIVPVHDVGTLADGRVFYVMKLVRGKRLDEHASANVSTTDLLRAFERICDAVGFAHAHDVIHRDLKPENVMVGPFGEVLVMDWGVAKVLGTVPDEALPSRRRNAPPQSTSSEERTDHGVVLGTPGYMAPEQAAGRSDVVSPRTDVYALGALLFFLLTGRSPATADDSFTLAPAQIPRPLAAIVAKAMNADPAQRYESAEALASDVTAYRSGLPVSAYRESIVERVGRVVQKYRTPILLVLAYLLMRVLLIFFGRT